MLWFYESFFPVVWVAFVLYWRIKAADTKTDPSRPGCQKVATFMRFPSISITSGADLEADSFVAAVLRHSSL